MPVRSSPWPVVDPPPEDDLATFARPVGCPNVVPVRFGRPYSSNRPAGTMVIRKADEHEAPGEVLQLGCIIVRAVWGGCQAVTFEVLSGAPCST